MAFLGRVMSAIRAGWQTYRDSAMIPIEALDWDAYEHRMMRYWMSDLYYNNAAYDSLRGLAAAAARRKVDKNLYKHIRGVYNPANRLVESYPAKIYGGTLDMTALEKGAIPIITPDEIDSEGMRNALRQLWLWSNWRNQKSLYVRNGAKFGDSFIKVVDEPERRKVRLEVLHPGKVKDIDCDSVGNITAITIQYEASDEQVSSLTGYITDKSYIYTEIIDKDGWSVYYDRDLVGEWDNPYGFVPVVHVQHRDEGLQFGANVYQAALSKIDEINDAASLLNDQIRKNVNVLWAFLGVSNKAEIKAETDERDKFPALYLPGENAQAPVPMVAPLNIADAGANLDRMLLELERDMPELALHRLRETGTQTAPGIRASYNDAIDKFVEAQGNYDDGLIRAHQMAISIGALRGYDGFEAFSADSYDRGELVHYIASRPIIEDQLTLQERIGYLLQSGAPREAIWSELDVPETTQDEWTALLDGSAQAQEDAIQSAIDALSQQPADTDTDDTDEEQAEPVPEQLIEADGA